MFSWAGDLSQHYAKLIAENADDGIAITNGVHHERLPIVKSYQHLGSSTTYNASIGPDVIRRCNIAFDDFRKLAKKIFRNPDITNGANINIANVSLLSKQGFQSGTWPLLRKVEYRKFKRAYMSIMRAMNGSEFDPDATATDFSIPKDSTVCDPLHMYHPTVYLRVVRLATASRLIANEHVLHFVPTIRGTRCHAFLDARIDGRPCVAEKRQ